MDGVSSAAGRPDKADVHPIIGPGAIKHSNTCSLSQQANGPLCPAGC